ncbi:MAG: hypothetical protein GY774_31735, partial [Planctomycetes bacterium]|nr:hypothetical protein [Planctomycetota bacterium]
MGQVNDNMFLNQQFSSRELEGDDFAAVKVLSGGDPTDLHQVVRDKENWIPLASDSRAFANFQFEFDQNSHYIDDTIQYCQEYANVDATIAVDDTLDVYSIAAAFNSSPLRLEMFEKWLVNYNWFDRAQILYDIKFGVRIPSAKRSPLVYVLHNHPSVDDHLEKVSDLIDSRVRMGIIAGPFEVPPPGIILSPLAAIPKKESGKVRLIHNLSFPYGDSVNSHTPRDFCTVHYETLDDCLKIVSLLGKNSLIAKADLADAYNCLLVSKLDFKFLGFSWKSKFYFGKTLPMGAGISCQQFERLSTAVQWILRAELHIEHMSHILDDFMFFGPEGSLQCSQSLKKFFILADSLGLPVKKEKTVFPSTCVELHGLMVNTRTMTLSVPPDKVAKALSLIDELLPLRCVTLRRVQSLAGVLSFFTRALPSARCFIRRIFDLFKGVTRPSHHVRLNAPAKADLRMWKVFLTQFNGTNIISHLHWSVDPEFQLFSDASGRGFSAIFGSNWFVGHFPTHWLDKSIAIKEMVPIF